ncbi:MAG: hypothetical protein FRX49_01241 [Trebouxia sp. A1-2]|nr:MAG: hypothetical protein FRX49_01241 [Trebouxia sp. A1-2]
MGGTSACQLVDVFLVLLDPGYTTTALACIRAAKRSLACGTVATRQANDSSVRIPADDACVAGAVLIVLLHSIAGEEWKALQDSIRLRLHHNCFALDWLREIWINSLRALSNALGIRAKFLPLLPSFFSIVHWLGTSPFNPGQGFSGMASSTLSPSMTASEIAALTAASTAVRLVPPFLAFGPGRGASGSFTGTTAAGGRPISPLMCLPLAYSIGRVPDLAFFMRGTNSNRGLRLDGLTFRDIKQLGALQKTMLLCLTLKKMHLNGESTANVQLYSGQMQADAAQNCRDKRLTGDSPILP